MAQASLSIRRAERSSADVGSASCERARCRWRHRGLAYTIKTLFGLERVASVDVQDRFLPSLGIETTVYDGSTLPFADGSFRLHPAFQRPASCSRALTHCAVTRVPRVAGRGPLYIKDHLSLGRGDDARLAVLDFLGNVPFSGMVHAPVICGRRTGGSSHLVQAMRSGERLPLGKISRRSHGDAVSEPPGVQHAVASRR